MRCCVKPRTGMIRSLAIAAAIIAVCTAADNNLIERDDDIVNVELYYAALCPDAARFVVNHLVPVYEELGDYMRVTYIPYGKGTHERITYENGTEQWVFTCQHGEEGCYGNKAHSCATNVILSSYGIAEEQPILVNFVGCAMSADNPARAVPECLETIGINANTITTVNNCIASTLGDELLAGHGDKTHALVPELDWVPTIVINEIFVQEDQDRAQVDFEGLICQYIPSSNRPALCNGATSLHTKFDIAAITILALFFCVEKETNYFF